MSRVKEQSNERRYFTMIPNLVLELGLSPLALALYVHLKRKAGDGGVCDEGLRALETETGISRSKLSLCRAELVEANLIEISAGAASVNAPQAIIVTDIWRKNAEHFASQPVEIPCPPNGHDDGPCPPNGHQRPPNGHACPPNGRSTYSTKNNNKNKEEEEGAGAPAGPDWDGLAAAAGIQNQPAPARKSKRSPANITESDDLRIAAYLEFCRGEITPGNADIITHRVPLEWAGYWRETCREFAANMWDVNKVGNLCERCERKARAAAARANDTATKLPQPPIDLEAERKRIERISAMKWGDLKEAA